MDSLQNRYRRHLWWSVVIFTGILLVAWTALGWRQYRYLEQQILRQIRHEQELILLKGAELAQDLIRQEQDSAKTRAETRARELVEQALRVIQHLHTSHAAQGKTALRRAIVESLRALHHDPADSYVFITTLSGEGWLYPLTPELEGKNVSHWPDTQAARLAREQIAAVKNGGGEALHRYYWLKPGDSLRNHEKISYLKIYPPLGIIVGAGFYEEDIHHMAQKRVLDLLSRIRFGPDAGFFAATWEGVSLLGPGKGRSMLHIRDLNGLPVVQEMIRIARQGGGSLEYYMPAETGTRPFRKLSYVVGIPEWQWYIGIGIPQEQIQASLAQRVSEAQRTQTMAFSVFLAVVIIAGLVSIWASKRMTRHLESQIRDFVRFFQEQSKDSYRPLPPSLVTYAEFTPIAAAANAMIEARQQLEQERESLLASLTEKNRELERVLHIASHDLRTPLVTIQGFSSELAKDVEQLAILAERDDDPEAVRQFRELASTLIPEEARFIRNAVLHMDQMIQGILRYSRAGRIQPDIQPLNLRDVIQDAIQTIQYLIRESATEIQVDPIIPPCLGDRSMVNQVLINILENALKYKSPERPLRVRIYGHTENDWTMLCVEDNGIGIDELHIEKIFDLFYRAHEHPGIPGDGLGLALCSRLMTRMNGRIWAESTPGVGSRFFLALPRLKSERKP